MTDCEIIPDTNTLVSASIFHCGSESGGQLKHDFYEESNRMFDLFRIPRAGITGHLLPSVRTESFSVMLKAVRTEVVSAISGGTGPAGLSYDDMGRVLDESLARMGMLMNLLTWEDLGGLRVGGNLRRVGEMSARLMDVWIERYRGRAREPGDRDAPQLRRFVRKYPNRPDELVLAEAYTLRQEPGNEGRVFVIASWDSGFFSPYVWPGGVSDVVTREVFAWFDIRCGRPGDVPLLCCMDGPPAGRQ